MSVPADDQNNNESAKNSNSGGENLFGPNLRHPSREEAITALKPYLDGLAACIREAWQLWKETKNTMPEQGTYVRNRARAALVYDFIWRGVRTRFENKPGVRIKEHRGIQTLDLHDKLTVRFKKLDKYYRSRNIPTRQNKTYMKQLPLDGFPESTRLTFGYVLDRFEQNIEEIALTLPYGESLIWSYVLPDGKTEMTITPFTEQEEAPPRTRRVKPKKSDKKDDQDDSQKRSNTGG